MNRPTLRSSIFSRFTKAMLLVACVVIAVVLWTRLSVAQVPQAAPQATANAPAVNEPVQRVYVPDSMPQSWPQGDWVPISGRELQLLLDSIAVPEQPPAIRLQSATYTGSLTGNVLSGTFVISINNLDATQQAYSLSPLNLSLFDLKLDDSPAIWGAGNNQKTYLIVPPGEHTLQGRWSSPCQAKLLETDCQLQLPSAELSSLDLTIPQEMDIDLNGGVQRPVGQPANGQQRWQILLGNRNEVRLVIRPRLSSQPARASIKRRSVTWTVNEDDASVSDTIEVKVYSGVLERMTLLTSPLLDIENVSLSSGEPLDFTTESSKTVQRLTIEFPAIPANTEFVFRLRGSMLNRNWRRWTMPECVPENILWQNHQVSIQLSQPLEYLSSMLEGYQMVRSPESTGGGQRLTYEKLSQTGKIALELFRPAFELLVHSKLDGMITPGGFVYRQEFEFTSLSGRVEQILCQIPDAAQVLDVRLVNDAISVGNNEEAFRWQISDALNRPPRQQLRIDVLKPQLASAGTRLQIDAFYRFDKNPWKSSASDKLSFQPSIRLAQGQVQKQQVQLKYDSVLNVVVNSDATPVSSEKELPRTVETSATKDLASLLSLLPNTLKSTLAPASSTTQLFQIPSVDQNPAIEIWNDHSTLMVDHHAQINSPYVNHRVELRIQGLLSNTDELTVDILNSPEAPIFLITQETSSTVLTSQRLDDPHPGTARYRIEPSSTGWESLTTPMIVEFKQLLSDRTLFPQVFIASLKSSRSHIDIGPLPLHSNVAGLTESSLDSKTSVLQGVYSADQEVLLTVDTGTTLVPAPTQVLATLSTLLPRQDFSEKDLIVHHRLEYALWGSRAKPVSLSIPESYTRLAARVDDKPIAYDPLTREIILPASSQQVTRVVLDIDQTWPQRVLWTPLSVPLPVLSVPVDSLAWKLNTEQDDVYFDASQLVGHLEHDSRQYAYQPALDSQLPANILTQRTSTQDRGWRPFGWLDAGRMLKGQQFRIDLMSDSQAQGLQLPALTIQTARVSTITQLSLLTAVLIIVVGVVIRPLRWFALALSLVGLICLLTQVLDPWSVLYQPMILIIVSSALLWLIPQVTVDDGKRSARPSTILERTATVVSVLISFWLTFTLLTSSSSLQAAQPARVDNNITILIPYSVAKQVTNAANRPPLTDEPIVYLERRVLADLQQRAQGTQLSSSVLFQKADYEIDVQLEQTLVFARYEVFIPQDGSVREISLPFQNVAFSGINGCFVDGRPASIGSSTTTAGILVTLPADSDPPPTTTSTNPQRPRTYGSSVIEIAFFLKKAPAPGTFFPVQLPFVHQSFIHRIDQFDFRYLVELMPGDAKPMPVTKTPSPLLNPSELHLKLIDAMPEPMSAVLTVTPDTLIDLRRNLADVSMTFQIDVQQAGVYTLQLNYPRGAIPIDLRGLQLMESQALNGSPDRPSTLLRLRFNEAGQYSIATRFLLGIPDKIPLRDFSNLVTLESSNREMSTRIERRVGRLKLQSKFGQQIVRSDEPSDPSQRSTMPLVLDLPIEPNPVELTYARLNPEDTTILSLQTPARQINLNSVVHTIAVRSQQLQIQSSIRFRSLSLQRFMLELSFPENWDIQQVDLVETSRTRPLTYSRSGDRLFIYVSENAMTNGQINIASQTKLNWNESTDSLSIPLKLPRFFDTAGITAPIQVQITSPPELNTTLTPETAFKPVEPDLELIATTRSVEVIDPDETLTLDITRPPQNQSARPAADFRVEFPLEPKQPAEATKPLEQAMTITSIPLHLTYALTSTPQAKQLLGELTIDGSFKPGQLLRLHLTSDLGTVTARSRNVLLPIASHDGKSLLILLPQDHQTASIQVSWTSPVTDWNNLSLPTPEGEIVSCKIRTAFSFEESHRFLVSYPSLEAKPNASKTATIHLQRELIPESQFSRLPWIAVAIGLAFITYLTRRSWWSVWTRAQRSGLPLIVAGIVITAVIQFWLGLGVILIGLCCWALSYPVLKTARSA
ncbi:hypothetical protein [Lacunimicrobium album]